MTQKQTTKKPRRAQKRTAQSDVVLPSGGSGGNAVNEAGNFCNAVYACALPYARTRKRLHWHHPQAQREMVVHRSLETPRGKGLSPCIPPQSKFNIGYIPKRRKLQYQRIRSIRAATIKSFSDSPPIACVESSMSTLL